MARKTRKTRHIAAAQPNLQLIKEPKVCATCQSDPRGFQYRPRDSRRHFDNAVPRLLVERHERNESMTTIDGENDG